MRVYPRMLAPQFRASLTHGVQRPRFVLESAGRETVLRVTVALPHCCEDTAWRRPPSTILSTFPRYQFGTAG